MGDRPVKITFADMRDSGMRVDLGPLLRLPLQPFHGADGRSLAGDLRLSDIRPNFNWNIQGPLGGMGYR
jgi:hypothetical protein